MQAEDQGHTGERLVPLRRDQDVLLTNYSNSSEYSLKKRSDQKNDELDPPI